MAGSHTGISTARSRFSHCAVAVGHVPSTGNALTGSASPLPAIITAVTRCTKSGASPATTAGRLRVAVAAVGNGYLVQMRQRRVDRGAVLLDHGRPGLAIGRFDRLPDMGQRVLARQDAGDGEEAGLHDGVDAHPETRRARDFVGVDDEDARALFEQRAFAPRARRCCQTVSGPCVVLSRNTPPGCNASSTSKRSRRSIWWQATKPARRMRYARPDGAWTEAQM